MKNVLIVSEWDDKHDVTWFEIPKLTYFIGF